METCLLGWGIVLVVVLAAVALGVVVGKRLNIQKKE